MTKRELAGAIGVTAPNITKYETISGNPKPETVQKMAFVLQFPLGWFYAPDLSLIDVNAPSFRSRRDMTAELRDKATRAGDIVSGVISPELRRRFVLPPIDVPDLSHLTPEQAAYELRLNWKLAQDPIPNLVHLLESKGIEVYWINENSSSLNAWSLWIEDQPFILLNIKNPAGDRARFDAAHELGHLVLHRHEKAIDKHQHEMQANSFASAFLMPLEAFKKEVPKYPVLAQFFPLKKKWGTSIAAMIMRSQSIGVYSEWQCRLLFKDISIKGWRTEEPVPIKREESLLHTKIFGRLVEKGVSPHDVAKSILLRPADFFEFVPAAEKLAIPQQQESSAANVKAQHLRLVV